MRGVTRTLAAIFVIEVVRLAARATDYLTGSALSQGVQYGDDITLPHVWGAACLISAAVVIVGFIRGSARTVVNGAFLACAVSFMFAASVAKLTVFHMPPDDWRLFFDHVCTGFVWLTLGSCVAFRSGVWARKLEIARERRAGGDAKDGL